jgi:hypothetical protein
MPAVDSSEKTKYVRFRDSRLWELCAAASLILAALFVIPTFPVMPYAGLDASWMYAINEILARGLVFGRDFIFTFGPLGSVYTGMFHPATDTLMMGGSALMAAGFCACFAVLAHRHRSASIFLLPLVVAETQSRDAIFMAIPFLLLVATNTVTRRASPAERPEIAIGHFVALMVAGAATGAAPLIKGSFAVPSLFLLCLTVVLLVRRKYMRLAAAICCAALSSLIATWLIAGQPLAWLPRFFIAQASIIGGYGEAMSLSGSNVPVWICLALFIGLALAFQFAIAKRDGLNGLIVSIGLAGYLFIAFKAAFVRQDIAIHLHIAMGTLLIVALVIGMQVPIRISAIVGLLVLGGWAVMEGQNGGLTAKSVLVPFETQITNIVRGSEARLSGEHRLDVMFRNANAEIRSSEPLPHVIGTTEIYPSELASIYANDLEWSGKPVPQSYSAYTPRLDQINADFLESNRAPHNLFYSTAFTIDNRLPAQQDAGSIKVMLSSYDVVGRTGPYVQMVRRSQPKDSGEVYLREIGSTINQRIDVPFQSSPVLARIEMRKSIVGVLASIAFRLPPIYIDTIFEDGRIQRNRYIPDMGKTGFIVAPFLGNEDDFVRIATGAPPTARVKQIMIAVDNPVFWRSKLKVYYSTLHRSSFP